MLILLPEMIICTGALLVAILGAAPPGPRAAPRAGWTAFAFCLLSFLSLPATHYLLPTGISPLPSWLSAALSFDPFALFFRLFAPSAGLIVILSSLGYVRARALPHPGEFYGLLLFALLGIMLLAEAVDIITIILSLELLSASCYVLTAFIKKDQRSAEGGLKYFLVGAISTAIMLYGLSLLFGLTGSTSLAGIAAALKSSPAGTLTTLAVVLTLVGFAFKVALVPFHTWCPDAYQGAPTPITAFLSVGPKAAGFAVLSRVFLTCFSPDVASWPYLLAGLSIVSMTVGNLLAIPQTNIKRMLAYSSISQAGYLLIGLVCATPWAAAGSSPAHAAQSLLPGGPAFGISALLLYLAAYLFMNLGAFLVVIAVARRTGTYAILDYSGLMQESPFLAVSLAVFFLSLAGVPPTGGFVGKLYLFAAAIGSGLWWLAVAGVVNSVISLYYYFNVVRNMFMRQASPSPTASEPEPLQAEPEGPGGTAAVLTRAGFAGPRVSSLSFAIAICLILTFLIALMPEGFISFARSCASGLGQ
jgi:NADH:ubiquinone oxidoreductase subunit 2 (subunit N)